MTIVTLTMSMSLDGFVQAANATPEKPLGVGGERLHEWSTSSDLQNTKYLEKAINSIGAVIAGRRTYNTSLPSWRSDGPTGSIRLPVFVVTHKAAETSPENGVYRFVTSGIEAAIAEAKSVAGKKGVCIMGGPDIGQQAIEAGCVDEIAINIAPVIFGSGKSFFSDFGRHIQLEPIEVIDTPLATHLRYRVIKKSK